MNTIDSHVARSPGDAMRRGVALLLATSCMIITALALSAPAGATGSFGPHAAVGNLSGGLSSSAIHANTAGTPLNLVNVVVTDLSTNESTVSSWGDPRQFNPPNTNCNAGGGAGVCMQFGGGYGSADGGNLTFFPSLSTTFNIAVDGVGCTTFNGGTANVEVDQFAQSGSTIQLVGVQFDCANSSVDISGTIAYNIVPTDPSSGYYVFGQQGELAGFGNDNYLTYLDGAQYYNLNAPIVGMAPTPDGGGYWMVGGDGGVFSSGDAGFYGSTGSLTLNKPVVGMAAAPDGKGYWFVASDGGVFNYGSAGFYGSAGSLHLNKPIVGMAATPSGHGYWLVASDGGIFAYGDAQFHGSTGSLHLNKPVVGMTPTPSGNGYWFVATDGGIFSYGDAGFFGSTGSIQLNQPIVGMAAAPDGKGYWFVASDGGVFNYGSATFKGSLGGTGVTDAGGISLGL